MDEIPAETVINFDHTVCSKLHTNITLDNGTRRDQACRNNSKDDKRQITVVFAGSSSGDFLLPQLIYEGKTDPA